MPEASAEQGDADPVNIIPMTSLRWIPWPRGSVSTMTSHRFGLNPMRAAPTTICTGSSDLAEGSSVGTARPPTALQAPRFPRSGEPPHLPTRP